MKRFNFYILIISIFSTILTAQAPDTLWTKTFRMRDRNVGNSVQQTFDGGYIITGRTTELYEGDVLLIKTDSIGDTLWTKTFGEDPYDEGNSIQQTIDGGYILTGRTCSFGSGEGDVWLIKTDSMGDTLWTKIYGADSVDGGNYVQQTSDGGYIVIGYTNGFYFHGVRGGKGWLIKTDALGDTLWTRTYEGTNCNSGQQTSDGGYILTGITHDGNVMLIKTDSIGDTLWTRTFPDSDTTVGNSVQQTNDGGYIIAGNFGGANAPNNCDVLLIKTDSMGDTLWTRIFGYLFDEWGLSVQQTNDGGFIVTGRTLSFNENNDVLLIKTDSMGNILWTKILNGGYGDWGTSVQQTSDGGYIITGYTNERIVNTHTYYDAWLIKIAPDPYTIMNKNNTSITEYHLAQNYPNPFNPTSSIEFSIPKTEFVILKVYNILGEEVATLVSERLAAGKYKYDWPARSSGGDGGSLASGVYLYRIQAGDYVEAKKMILLR